MRFPPPLAHPHLTIDPLGPRFVGVHLPGFILNLVLERWIREELFDAFNRVASPEFNLLGHRSPIAIDSFSIDCHLNEFPLRASWEGVNLVK